MNQAKPKTDAGKNLKDLKQKSEKLERDKKLEQLRPATERMVKNTQPNYEKNINQDKVEIKQLLKGLKQIKNKKQVRNEWLNALKK